MSAQKKLVVVTAIILLVASGAGAALAAGNDAARSRTTVVVGNDAQRDEAGETAHGSYGTEHEAEGPDRPITGQDLERASRVALEFLGGGRVSGTEVEDEESYYEVEVTLDDGNQIDVQLDESFNVVGTD